MAHKKLCKVCSKKDHDTCALVNGCPCCEDTMNQMQDADNESEGEDEEE